MAYDRKRDRFILGSLDYGTLLAVPRSAAVGRNIQYSSEDVTMLLSSRPAAFNGSNFLGLTMDPVEDAVWGCISYGERRTYGVAKVNMKDNAVDFYDLTALVDEWNITILPCTLDLFHAMFVPLSHLLFISALLTSLPQMGFMIDVTLT